MLVVVASTMWPGSAKCSKSQRVNSICIIFTCADVE